MLQFNHSPITLVQLEMVGSTNDEALAALNSVPAIGLWTLNQQAGRGSRGRSWDSPAGCGLALSLAFRDSVAPPPTQWCYPLYAGIIWYETLSQLGTKPGLSLKWPNDIFWRDRKLAGILCESRWLKDRVHTVIGIGTNLKPHSQLDALPAGYASLSECLPQYQPIQLVEMAVRLFDEGFSKYRDQEYLRQTWLKHAWIHLEQPVRVFADQREFNGSFQGLNSEGALSIRTDQGSLIHIQPTCTDFRLEPLDDFA